MLRRTLLVKLKPEHREGLPRTQLTRAAETAWSAAYGVQHVRVENAADDETRRDWDLAITIDYVSGVDEERSGRDPIRRAFVETFLGTRAERVWSGTFARDD